ncbi:MAG: lysine 2,3-aminomutase [Halobacteriovoraceae bacterium]|nr:lysine 2,3-aminomutase [Halobacteriovoraceae bacterium]
MKTPSSHETKNYPTWMQIMKEAITSTKELETFLETSLTQTPYSLFIPRPFAQRIKEAGIDSPLGRQFIPHAKENIKDGLEDPIADHLYSKGNGIIHRYRNRILFSPTEICPIQCRYCFRKNELGQQDDIFKAKRKALEQYLQEHPEVEEVIFTGGDPLILSNSKIDQYLHSLANISSVKMVRFHSRTPVILPERIDNDFIQLISRYSLKFDIVSLVIHTNHTSEWSPLFLRKINQLRALPINLLSQSVLLKGVNDQVDDLVLLFKMLVINGIRPYYLHHPDPVKGATYFQLSLEEGRKIFHQLKKRVSGFILPHYVVELPNGKGKALAFNSQNFNSDGKWIDKDGEWIENPF